MTEQATVTVSIEKILLDITPDDYKVIQMALMKVSAPAEITQPTHAKINEQAMAQAQAELDRQQEEKKPKPNRRARRAAAKKKPAKKKVARKGK